jgi:16S rRNA (uracil1498-N3)-methyltransferase
MKKIHRFFTPFSQNGNNLKIEDYSTIKQIKEVLKLRTGEQCIIIHDNINIYAEITKITKESIELIFIKNELILEPETKITLYMAILKKENFELVVQKASELGIHTIVPIITDRTVKTGLRYDRLEKIAKEASELSGYGTFPYILESVELEQALIKDTNTVKLFFDISGDHIHHVLQTTDFIKNKERSIYIGPEGGFTEKEINLAKEYNCKITKIDNFTLRGETAAIIASYITNK